MKRKSESRIKYLKNVKIQKFGSKGSPVTEELQGFIFTTGLSKSEIGTKEAFNWLRGNAARLKLDKNEGEHLKSDRTENSGSDEDISKTLQNEATTSDKESSSHLLFQQYICKVPNTLFISLRKDCTLSPADFCLNSLTNMQLTKSSSSKFIHRVVPVLATCKVSLSEIEATADRCLGKFFKTGEGRSFCIQFKACNNGIIKRQDVIQKIANIVKLKDALARVDLTNAELVIDVQVLQNFAAISVMPDYFKLKKYNLQMIIAEEIQNKNEDKCEKAESSTL